MLTRNFSILLHSSESDKIYEAVSLAAASRAQGKFVQIFFTGPALKKLVSGLEASSELSPQDVLAECRGRDGFRIYACSTWVRNLKIDEKKVLENADAIVGLATFLEQAGDGQIIFV